MMHMVEDLDIHDGHRILEIGTGTGYNAALLSERLGDTHVTSIDIWHDPRDGFYPTSQAEPRRLVDLLEDAHHQGNALNQPPDDCL